MRILPALRGPVVLLFLLMLVDEDAFAQTFEMVGSRALGMGGAFVAVANDSSATWWNPAGLADGPFLDLSAAWARSQSGEADTAGRERVRSLSLGTPPIGLAYYRLRITGVRPSDPIEPGEAGRQDRETTVSLRSLAASQVGVTVLRTLVQGVHMGATLKYLRGSIRHAQGAGSEPVGVLLDRGEAVEGGDVEHHVDVDLGVLAVVGPVRVGGVGRNVRASKFSDGEFVLPRQIRLGVAVDLERAGGVPLTIALDADARAYAGGAGRRRVVAVGAEQWVFRRRVGMRGGIRVNTVGDRSRAGAAGVSVAARTGLYIDAHVVRGGAVDERGWGMAARVSF